MRGVAVRGKRGGLNYTVFGGTTSEFSGSQFFRGAQAEHSAGMLMLDRAAGKRLHWFSTTLVATRPTSIQSLQWSALPGLKLAASGGIGSGDPYGAASLNLEHTALTVNVSYVKAGSKFQRLAGSRQATSEMDRENIEISYRPLDSLSFTVARHNFFQPLDAGGEIRELVDQVPISSRITMASVAALRSSILAVRSSGVWVLPGG